VKNVSTENWKTGGPDENKEKSNQRIYGGVDPRRLLKARPLDGSPLATQIPIKSTNTVSNPNCTCAPLLASVDSHFGTSQQMPWCHFLPDLGVARQTYFI